MNPSTWQNLVGWSAVINGVTSIISTITLALMFTIGGPWGRINDSDSVIWALTFVPLAIFFYRINQSSIGSLSLLATIAGVTAMIIFAISQTLLAAGLVQFEQTFTLVLVMGGLIGGWLFLQGILARTTPILPTPLLWLMMAYGLSFILSMIGFLIGGWENPLALAGFLVGAVLGPIWAIWLGRVLLNSQVLTAITLPIQNSA